jgi:hypothetical protein
MNREQQRFDLAKAIFLRIMDDNDRVRFNGIARPAVANIHLLAFLISCKLPTKTEI